MKFNLKSNIILTFSLLALMPSLAFSESVIVGAAVPPPPQKKNWQSQQTIAGK